VQLALGVRHAYKVFVADPRGADQATELDTKRTIDQGCRLAAAL
jgi:hypothetical protein